MHRDACLYIPIVAPPTLALSKIGTVPDYAVFALRERTVLQHGARRAQVIGQGVIDPEAPDQEVADLYVIDQEVVDQEIIDR